MFTPAKALSLSLLMGSAVDDASPIPDAIASATRRVGRAGRLSVVLAEGRSSLADMRSSERPLASLRRVPTAFGTLEIEQIAGKTRARRLDPLPTATLVQIFSDDSTALEEMAARAEARGMERPREPFMVSSPAVAEAMLDLAAPAPTLAAMVETERRSLVSTPSVGVSVGSATTISSALRAPQDVITSIPRERLLSSTEKLVPSREGEMLPPRVMPISPAVERALQLKKRIGGEPKLDLAAFVSESRSLQSLAGQTGRVPAVTRTVTMGMTMAPRDVVALGRAEPKDPSLVSALPDGAMTAAPILSPRAELMGPAPITVWQFEPSSGPGQSTDRAEAARVPRPKELWPVAAVSIDRTLVAPKLAAFSFADKALEVTSAARAPITKIDLSHLDRGLTRPTHGLQRGAPATAERVSSLAALRGQSTPLGTRPTAVASMAARRDMVSLLASGTPFDVAQPGVSHPDPAVAELGPGTLAQRRASSTMAVIPAEMVSPVTVVRPFGTVGQVRPVVLPSEPRRPGAPLDVVHDRADTMGWASDLLREAKTVAFRAMDEVRGAGRLSPPTQQAVRRVLSLAEEVGSAVPGGRTMDKELLPLLVRIEQASDYAQDIARSLGTTPEIGRLSEPGRPSRQLHLAGDYAERPVVGVTDYHSELSGTVAHLSAPRVQGTASLPESVGGPRVSVPAFDAFAATTAPRLAIPAGEQPRRAIRRAGRVGRPSFGDTGLRLLQPFTGVFSPATGQPRMVSVGTQPLELAEGTDRQLQYVASGELGFGPPRRDVSPSERHARRITERVAGRLAHGVTSLVTESEGRRTTPAIPGAAVASKQEALQELASKGYTVAQLQQALRRVEQGGRPAADAPRGRASRTVSSLVSRILADVGPKALMKARPVESVLSSLDLGMTSLVTAATDPGLQAGISGVALQANVFGSAEADADARPTDAQRPTAWAVADLGDVVSVSDLGRAPVDSGVSRRETVAGRGPKGTSDSPRAKRTGQITAAMRPVTSIFDPGVAAASRTEKGAEDGPSFDFQWLKKELASLSGPAGRVEIGSSVSTVGRPAAAAAAERLARYLDKEASQAEASARQRQTGGLGQVVGLSGQARGTQSGVGRTDVSLGSAPSDHRALPPVSVQGEPVASGRQYVEPWRAFSAPAPDASISPLARVSAQSVGQEGDRSDTAGAMASPPQEKLKQMAEEIFGIIKDRLDEEAARFGR